MNRAILFGGAALILAAAPGLAQQAGKGGRGREARAAAMNAPQSRADAEAKVSAHFAKLDTNGDGSVTQAEADGARTAMHADRVNAHFESMDTNKDGSISRAEFDVAHQGAGGKNMGKADGDGEGGNGGGRKRGANLMRADANNDGKVTRAEMVSAAMARFDAADADKNGIVTPEERRAARQARRGQKSGQR